MVMHDKALTEAICALTCAVRELGEQLVNENKLILHRIETKVDKIMAKLEDLIVAASALSTASDGVSVKLDNLISKVDAFIAAVPGSDLTPPGEAALAALKIASANAAAAGDKVDAEVAKLDGVLPVPAPPAPPTP